MRRVCFILVAIPCLVATCYGSILADTEQTHEVIDRDGDLVVGAGKRYLIVPNSDTGGVEVVTAEDIGDLALRCLCDTAFFSAGASLTSVPPAALLSVAFPASLAAGLATGALVVFGGTAMISGGLCVGSLGVGSMVGHSFSDRGFRAACKDLLGLRLTKEPRSCSDGYSDRRCLTRYRWWLEDGFQVRIRESMRHMFLPDNASSGS